ncbi:extracellular solute-binding protein [Cellulomonas sp. 179-A 9B4 NHS]|uniref:sugar ABC transporter substrate-binding protein n=1 Tax=Cellulomonas sp. 179-A 9B4 NHS TaxID=3142379 RepID=UPI0039A1DD87
MHRSPTPRRARRVAAPAVVVSLALLAAACAGDAPGAAPAGEAERITVWTDEDRLPTFEALAAEHTAATGVAVTVEGRANDELRQAFLAGVGSGRGPDVLVGAHDWLGELVAAGAVVPVALDDPAAFVPAAVQAVAYDGDTYGVPLSTENVALVRNDDLTRLDPATFEEAVAEGERLVAAGRADRPLLLQQTEAASDPYHLYPLQTSFGVPVFAADATGSYTSELALAGEGGHAFAAYLGELGDRGVLDPAVDADVARETFEAGRAPFVVTGPWNVPAFLEAGIDVTVLPVPPAGPQPAQPFVGVQAAFVSATTPREPLALAFVASLAAPEVQARIAEATGRAPAVAAAVDAFADDPVLQGFSAAGAEGAPMPAIPQMSVVWSFWGSVEHQLVTGSGDPAALWDGMVAGIEGAVADA